MYEKVFEQAESFFKPFNEIVTLNMQALDKMREQQVELVNELVSDGIEYARDMSKPTTDINEIISAQQSYFECVKNKITSNAYSSYDFWSDVQGKSGELWQAAIDNASKEASAGNSKKKSSAKKTTKKSSAKAEESKAEDAPGESASQ